MRKVTPPATGSRTRLWSCGAVGATSHARRGHTKCNGAIGVGRGTKKNLEAEDGSGGEAEEKRWRGKGEAVWRGKGRAVWSRGRADQAFCHKSELRSCNRGLNALCDCGLMELRRHTNTLKPKLRGNSGGG